MCTALDGPNSSENMVRNLMYDEPLKPLCFNKSSSEFLSYHHLKTQIVKMDSWIDYPGDAWMIKCKQIDWIRPVFQVFSIQLSNLPKYDIIRVLIGLLIST